MTERHVRVSKPSTSGLRDVHRRSLARLIFLATAGVLFTFGSVQLFNDNVILAIGEFTIATLLIAIALRMKNTPHLRRWIYVYLVATFSFLVYIILMPRASTTAFVWVFMMPVLSYLLAGRFAGFIIAAPFMLVGGVMFFMQLEALDNARVMVDFLNPLVCALMILLFMHFYELRRAEAEERLVLLAETDALTGLANRSHFRATLQRTVNECRRSRNSFALVLMDIDHFKRINDTLGHDAGDAVLRHIGLRLTERLRTTDAVGRLGGEEFGLILRDVSDKEAYGLVEELRCRIAAEKLTYGDDSVGVTASFGVAYWPDDADDPHALYCVADRRLYAGKTAGRNVVSDRDEPATDVPAGVLTSETAQIEIKG